MLIGNNLGGGIVLDGQGTCSNTLRENRIGLSLDNSALPRSSFGVRLRNGAAYTQVGPANRIANNGVGVQAQDAATDFNTLTQNAIYGNSRLGIDLDPPGVNLPAAPTGGPNQQVPLPELPAAHPGWISGRGCGGCTVEIFVADRRTDQYGQGKLYLGSALADAQGNFGAPVQGPAAGDYVTATATDRHGNTSEFARTLRVALLKIYLPRMLRD